MQPRSGASPAPPFRRSCAGGSFFVRQGLSPKSDVAPPSRVLDLRVAPAADSSAEDVTLAARLEWTAPGGDYDQGKGEGTLPRLSSLPR